MGAKKIPLKKLNIDDAYQRGYRKNHVKKIVDDFDPDAFRPLLVGVRKDGTHWVVDGHHRYLAAEQMGMTSVEVTIFVSKGQSHEAEIFLKSNESRRVAAIDKLHAAYCSGVTWAVEIVEALAERGLEMAFQGRKGKWPYIATVEPLRMLHEKCGRSGIEKLAHVLVCGFTSNDPDATHQTVVSGVSYFLCAWPEADYKRLTDIVGRRKRTGAKLISDANSINLTGGGNSRRKCAGQILWKWYNYRMKSSGKLPPMDVFRESEER